MWEGSQYRTSAGTNENHNQNVDWGIHPTFQAIKIPLMDVVCRSRSVIEHFCSCRFTYLTHAQQALNFVRLDSIARWQKTEATVDKRWEKHHRRGLRIRLTAPMLIVCFNKERFKGACSPLYLVVRWHDGGQFTESKCLTHSYRHIGGWVVSCTTMTLNCPWMSCNYHKPCPP